MYVQFEEYANKLYLLQEAGEIEFSSNVMVFSQISSLHLLFYRNVEAFQKHSKEFIALQGSESLYLCKNFCMCIVNYGWQNIFLPITTLLLKSEKGRELTQPCDKKPLHLQNNLKKQRDNTNTPPKTLITQLLRNDLGWSVG